MSSAHRIGIWRLYDTAGHPSGARLLVDRLWPRGIARAALALDDWIPEVAPSTALRKWFGHDPAKWQEFRNRYLAELAANPEPVEKCLLWCRKGPVVLLYGAKDREHNQAVVLRQHLQARIDGKGGTA